jgi:uncharacterized protein YecT (DUF1311 family)
MAFLVSISAQAADPCDNTSTQKEMNVCTIHKAQLADTEMNTVYRLVLKQVPARSRQKLVAAQRLWIPFRNGSCEFEGSQVPSPYSREQFVQQCLERETVVRTSRLGAYSSSPGKVGYADVASADRRLNKTYQNVISDDTNRNLPKLVQAERAWIRYRDAVCMFERLRWGQTVSDAEMVGQKCLQELIQERTSTLKQFTDSP